jgi:hypothetical protein
MKLSEVIAQRKSLLSSPAVGEGVTFQDLSGGQSATERMAIGYLRLDNNKYRLEVRLQSEHGSAFRAAMTKLRELGDSVRVLVSDLIQLPKRGETEATRVADPALKQRAPRLMLGLSIAHPDSYAGSIGYFGQKNRKPGLMSAAHVLGPMTKAGLDLVNENHYIYQPGKPDGDAVSDGQCARLAAHLALSASASNPFDAAFAHLMDRWEFLGNVVPKVVGVPKRLVNKPLAAPVTSKQEDHEGAEVFKIGRTTAYTTARISGVDMIANDIGRVGAGTYKFDNMIEVFQTESELRKACKFADAGDSGACYVLADGLRPIGLHTAGGSVTKQYKMKRTSASGQTEPTPIPLKGYQCFGSDLETAMTKLGVAQL